MEDLAPNLIEVDPIETESILKNKISTFYVPFSMIDIQQIQGTNNLILPLPEIKREEQWKRYKLLNKKYYRTNVFEKGIAKMLMVRNREIVE